MVSVRTILVSYVSGALWLCLDGGDFPGHVAYREGIVTSNGIAELTSVNVANRVGKTNIDAKVGEYTVDKIR